MCEQIFGDIPVTDAAPAHATFRISAPDDVPQLECDGKVLYSGTLSGDLANHLVGETIYHLCDVCDSGLVFHAAALHGHGITVALPANSGSGKTTLTGWLLTQGFAYLTDELVHIPTGTQTLVPFTRPLNFKTPSFDLIKNEFGVDARSEECLHGSWASLVPHRQLGEPFRYHTPELTHVVYPKYSADAEPHLTPVTPARSGLSLMETLVNARNLEGHGFGEVSRLTRKLDAFQVGYSSFDQAAELLLPALGIKSAG